MTKNKFFEMIAFANKIGINTVGELAEYKKRNNLKTNDELFNSLCFEDFKNVAV